MEKFIVAELPAVIVVWSHRAAVTWRGDDHELQ
jgi:hypothetical protein